MTSDLPECVDGLPNLSGSENVIEQALAANRNEPAFLRDSRVPFHNIRSACAVALHMHQPLIPAGGEILRSAKIIGNLQHMMEHPGVGDNHNASVFLRCYQRMGEFVPQLLEEGKEPRVMLEYSGTLLYGLRQMGSGNVLDSLRPLACRAEYQRAVEWLGGPWGHAVAPSTPVQDFRLHVRAWQHHFAALFGLDAVTRVRGFSPSEMALPNHPDVAYEFVRTLNDCGYSWVLVQEHTIELRDDGAPPRFKHLPHLLSCTNSNGETASIVAVIKTQGSDTKLVAQMQPYYEAKGLSRVDLAGHSVPPLVVQIADGENGGVMMNEFPGKYFEVVRGINGQETPLMNVSEYLEHLFAAGVKVADLPVIQPALQKRIWDRLPAAAGAQRLVEVIADLRQEDDRFHMEGGSWTNNLSWVRGYEDVLGPMEEASSLFHEKASRTDVDKGDRRYRNALFHLLASQTSCYRYWGHGTWTDYGREICRRTKDILIHDF